MNPMTNVKNIKKLSEEELKGKNRTSWHDQYRESAWIFVGGLHYDLTEGDIICVFSQYGEPVNINLVRDKDTGKSKGFCFLCYEDQRSTDLAVDNFNGIKLLGRTIRVDHVENYKPPKTKEGESKEKGTKLKIEKIDEKEEKDKKDSREGRDKKSTREEKQEKDTDKEKSKLKKKKKRKQKERTESESSNDESKKKKTQKTKKKKRDSDKESPEPKKKKRRARSSSSSSSTSSTSSSSTSSSSSSSSSDSDEESKKSKRRRSREKRTRTIEELKREARLIQAELKRRQLVEEQARKMKKRHS